MRTIEFRGKRVDNGEWVYGYVDATMYKDIVVIHTETGTFGVDQETVGQYTGYKDDEGLEIFEGDLIRYQYEDNDAYTGWHGLREVTDEVVFEYGSFRLKNTYPFNIDSLWDMNNPKIEVIGNIHDNHELMKGGEK